MSLGFRQVTVPRAKEVINGSKQRTHSAVRGKCVTGFRDSHGGLLRKGRCHNQESTLVTDVAK